MIVTALLAAALTVVPVHGVVLDPLAPSQAIVRLDAVPQTIPPLTRRMRFDRRQAPSSGTQIDAYLDRSTDPWTLREPEAADAFAPGAPDRGRVIAVDLTSPLPDARLVDQDGHFVELARDFAGKTVLLSFIFTRCPDATLCPAISGKFAYLQDHLDPAKFALVEITLDPPYDSPAILRAYARTYGARRTSWTLLTGTGSTIQRVLDEFGIDSMRLSTNNFLHNDKLFIVSPQGRIADVIATADWDPQAAVAQARAVAGLSSNPFERFKLSLIAGVIALCGGSQAAGSVLLELGLFAVIVLVVTVSLWAVARVLWAK